MPLQVRFTDARRAEENERTYGAFGVFQPRSCSLHRLCNGRASLVLSDNFGLQCFSRLTSFRSRPLLFALRGCPSNCPRLRQFRPRLWTNRCFTFLFPLDFGFFFLLDIIVAECLVFSAKFVVFSAFCLAQIEFGLLDFVFQIANFAGSGKGKIFFLDAASSIRSIALSGRNLSATYLSDKIAAEDIASSVIVTP